MAWNRKKALKDVTISAFSQYAVLAIVVLRGFLFTKYLGPEGFGVWVSVYFFFTFGQYCHLGLYNSVVFLAPDSIGKGKTEETNKMLSSAITWINLFGLIFILTIVSIIFSGLFPFVNSNRLSVLLAAVSAFLVLNFNFSVYRLQLKQNFKKAGLFQVLLAVTDIIISFILMMKYGLPGAYIGMAISLIIFVALIAIDGYNDLHICFDKPQFKKLFDIGFRVLFVSLGFAVLTLSDKLSVTSFFSITDMGYFSNAVSLAMLPYTLALVLSGITTQRMLEEYGRTNEKKSIKIFLDESIFAVAFLIPFFSVLLIAFAEPVINLLLPKYVNSLRFVDKLSVGVYFLAVSMSCYSFLLILKKYFLLFSMMIVLIVMVFITNSYLAGTGYDVLSVSYVTVICYSLFAFLLYYFSYSAFYSFKKITWMFFRLSLPVIPILLAFSMKFYIIDNSIRFGARFFIALVWAFFAYFYLTRKTTILSQLIGMVKGKII